MGEFAGFRTVDNGRLTAVRSGHEWVEVLKGHDRLFRLEIHSDHYDFQSWANLKVFNGTTWAEPPLVKLPGEALDAGGHSPRPIAERVAGDRLRILANARDILENAPLRSGQ